MSLETGIFFHQCQSCVRFLIGRINKVFESAINKSKAEVYRNIQRRYSNSAVYMVGGNMARMIEEHLGKEALVDSVQTGPRAFVQAYNSITEEGIDIQCNSPEQLSDTLFLEVVNAAITQDNDAVRETLAAIRMSGQPMDIETDGYELWKSGYAVLYQGQLTLAEETFHLLVDTFPDLDSLHIGLGAVYVQQGNHFAAIVDYGQAVELEPLQQW